VVATSTAAAELLRQGDVAGAARAFAAATPREGYTVQLLVACAPQTAVNAAQHAPGGEVFVLPIVYGGRDCFRVAYGRYANETAAAAALASAVPDYFKTETRPRVESLAKIVP
jgi:septal ring-binding cell division protein DamX